MPYWYVEYAIGNQKTDHLRLVVADIPLLGGLRLLMGRYNPALHMLGWRCRHWPGNRHREGIVFASCTSVARLGVLQPFYGILFVQHRNQYFCDKYVKLKFSLIAPAYFLPAPQQAPSFSEFYASQKAALLVQGACTIPSALSQNPVSCTQLPAS